jgi:L-alanine-DL-glutamate epimerase-like enolase superfamily enzyme
MPLRIEDIWQYLYKRRLLASRPDHHGGHRAIDMALWDIKAKAPACRSTSCSAAARATR